MAKKIKPTSRQKSIFLIHTIVFAVASFLMWTLYDKGATSWVYPWPAWITAAWALSLIGHWCALFTSYEDAGLDEFNRLSNN
jgi:cation transport ATPase